jgi:hypothetical protein
MSNQRAQPGWYDDGQGKQRWWTGKRWSISWLAANTQTRHRMPAWIVVAGIAVGCLIIFASSFYIYEAIQAWDASWNNIDF